MILRSIILQSMTVMVQVVGLWPFLLVDLKSVSKVLCRETRSLTVLSNEFISLSMFVVRLFTMKKKEKIVSLHNDFNLYLYRVYSK